MKEWTPKAPGAVLDYYYDWSGSLLTGETIASYTLTLFAGDVVIDSHSENAGVIQVWLSGGTLWQFCIVLCEIMTNQGRTDAEYAKLLIRLV